MLVSLGFQVVVLMLEATGVRAIPEDKKLVLEFDFGAQLAAWNSFALAYLLLGARAFCRIGRRELVRRLSGSPPPRSAVDTAITTPANEALRHPAQRAGCCSEHGRHRDRTVPHHQLISRRTSA